MELLTIALILLVGLFILAIYALKKMSGSWLFWTLALGVTLVLFPFTAGMSPVALGALITVRIVMIVMMFRKSHRPA